MQFQPNTPVTLQRWPTDEMRQLADKLGRDQSSCSSYHLYASCEKDTMKEVTLKIVSTEEAALQSEFPKHAVALYKSIFLSGCSIATEQYQRICHTFSKTRLGPLFTPPSQLDIDLQAIHKAFTHYKGSLTAENGLQLHYEIQWQRSGILRIEVTLNDAPSQEKVATISPVELLALRLYCIMQGRLIQSNQGILAESRAMGAKAAKSMGLVFLTPDPTDPKTLSYNVVSPHIGIAMDSQSSGPIKRYRELPSATFGVLRITLRPGESDPGHCYYRFDLQNPNLFTPDQLWEMREMLSCEFFAKRLAITSLISIVMTFFQPIKVNDNVSTIIVNNATAPYLQTLLPICLQKHLETNPRFVQSLVEACLRVTCQSATLFLDDLQFP